jgi:hypothetical protein
MISFRRGQYRNLLFQICRTDGESYRYDLGRDYLVGNLTGTQVESSNVTNSSTFSGQASFDNYTYQTNVKYVSGLLNDSSSE